MIKGKNYPLGFFLKGIFILGKSVFNTDLISLYKRLVNELKIYEVPSRGTNC
ncbi:hypothetical protein GEPA3_1834 [Geobacillus sp. PA-3]|jgi:hypothetical protein|nr:hypothetical protein GEPA3_1834 [Geobacillus sp. PA-3]